MAIVAHLTDQDGATFPGSMTAYNGSGRVTPAATLGAPDARFSYAAAASAPAGGTDVVQLSHVSRRGKARGGTVTVIYDNVALPARFDGTWTRVRTNPGVRPGWRETLHGTAIYLRDPSPPTPDRRSSVIYKVQSASVDWTVSGSDNPSGQCTNTYSGSGTAPATENSSATTQLTLEDVSGNPSAPQPEPSPFYYSIQASGDPANLPRYDVIHTPANCAIDYQEVISGSYLNIGWDSDIAPGTPPDQIQKSSDVRQLAGHRTGTDEFGFAVDDTWSFIGSG